MADMTINTAAPDMALQTSQDVASTNRAKTGQHVVSDAQRLAQVSPIVAATQTDAAGSAAPAAKKDVLPTGAPSLPDPVGTQAPAQTVMRVVRGSDVFAGGGDSLFAALQATTQARQQDQNNAGKIKAAQNANNLGAKMQEKEDKIAEQKGQVVSAITKFGGSMLGLAGTGYVSAHGSYMETGKQPKKTDDAGQLLDGAEKTGFAKKWEDHRAHTGAAMRNVGQSLSGATDNTVNLIDMSSGGQAKAMQAQVDQKQDAIQAQINQNNADSANTWLESAKDQRKSTQQDLMTIIQRHEQAGLKASGG